MIDNASELKMKNIIYRDMESGDITFLKDLCNGLMAFQAEHATIRPEIMAGMNFENRLVPDFENTERKYITVAFEKDIPVGFAFAAVGQINRQDLTGKPDWAKELQGQGFYPQDYEIPKIIGTFKLLFVDPNYRGYRIGINLSDRIMTWLKSQNDVEDLWVFVANGNEIVGKFYEKLGFVHSHAVFNGFIEAYTQSLERGKL